MSLGRCATYDIPDLDQRPATHRDRSKRYRNARSLSAFSVLEKPSRNRCSELMTPTVGRDRPDVVVYYDELAPR